MENQKYNELSNRLSLYANELKNGKNDSFENIYNESFNYSFNLVKGYVKNEDDASDLVQDGYITILNKIHTLEDTQKFMGWMKSIFINSSLNYIKKKKPELFLNKFESEDEFYNIQEDDDTSIEEKIITKESEILISNLFEKIPEKQRIVIQLIYIDGLSIKEVSEALSISEGTVKSRIYYGKESLKTLMIENEKRTGNKLYSSGIFTIIFMFLSERQFSNTESIKYKDEIWTNIINEANILSEITSNSSEFVETINKIDNIKNNNKVIDTINESSNVHEGIKSISTLAKLNSIFLNFSPFIQNIIKITTTVVVVSLTAYGLKYGEEKINEKKNMETHETVNQNNETLEEIKEVEKVETLETDKEITKIIDNVSIAKVYDQDFYKNPYILQRIGQNPVYYYQHPTRDIALDFSSNPELARKYIVIPIEQGFYIDDRVSSGLRSIFSVFNDGKNEELISYFNGISIFEITDENRELVFSYSPRKTINKTEYSIYYTSQSGEEEYYLDNQKWDILDFISASNESFNFNEYSTNIDQKDILDYLVISKDTNKKLREGKQLLSFDEEYKNIETYLRTNPLTFEILYNLPSISGIKKLDNLGISKLNENNLITEPFTLATYKDVKLNGISYSNRNYYDIFFNPSTKEDHMKEEYFENELTYIPTESGYFENSRHSIGTFDFNKDEKKELIVRGNAKNNKRLLAKDLTEDINGYIAIFTETNDGLMMINSFHTKEFDSRYLAIKDNKIFNINPSTKDDEYKLIERDYYYNFSLSEDKIDDGKDKIKERLISKNELLKMFDKNYLVLDTKLDNKTTELKLQDIVLVTDINDIFENLETVVIDYEQQVIDYIKNIDFGPDTYVEYSIYDIDKDGNEEYIVHKYETSTTTGVVQNQTWEIFKGENGKLVTYHSDYLGRGDLVINNGNIITWNRFEVDEKLSGYYIGKAKLDKNSVNIKTDPSFDTFQKMIEKTDKIEFSSVKDNQDLIRKIADEYIVEGEVLIMKRNTDKFHASESDPRFERRNILKVGVEKFNSKDEYVYYLEAGN